MFAAHVLFPVDRAVLRCRSGGCEWASACSLPGDRSWKTSPCLPAQRQPLLKGQEYWALTAEPEPSLVSVVGPYTLTGLGILWKTHMRTPGRGALCLPGWPPGKPHSQGPQRAPRGRLKPGLTSCSRTEQTSQGSCHDFCGLRTCAFVTPPSTNI